jgi:hypothetical protein
MTVTLQRLSLLVPGLHMEGLYASFLFSCILATSDSVATLNALNRDRQKRLYSYVFGARSHGRRGHLPRPMHRCTQFENLSSR